LIEKTNGGFLISRVKQIQDRFFTKLLSDANIAEFNGAQGRILYILWQSDCIPIVEIAKKTSLAKNTLTSMLDRMEESGLIMREADKNDRRQINIILSEKAQSLKKDFDRISMKSAEIFYKGFTDDEIILFEEQLNKILNNLKEAEENYNGRRIELQ